MVGNSVKKYEGKKRIGSKENQLPCKLEQKKRKNREEGRIKIRRWSRTKSKTRKDSSPTKTYTNGTRKNAEEVSMRGTLEPSDIPEENV